MTVTSTVDPSEMSGKFRKKKEEVPEKPISVENEKDEEGVDILRDDFRKFENAGMKYHKRKDKK